VKPRESNFAITANDGGSSLDAARVVSRHSRLTALSDGIYTAKHGRWAFLIGLAPSLVLYSLLLVVPMLILGRFSFYLMPPGRTEVIAPFTLSNYSKFLGSPFYLGILGETLFLSLVVVLVCVVLAYPIAIVVAHSRRWKTLLLLAILAPFFVSQVIKTYGWMVILSDRGLVNWLLLASGLSGQSVKLLYNRTGVVIGMVHVLVPFVILTLESVIRQIPAQVLDAARSLGAREWQVFVRVVLPMSIPGLVSGALLVFALAISIFTTPALMGGDRIQLISNFIYKRAVSVLDWPLAAVASWVLMIVTLAIILLCLRLLRPRWTKQ
jgi:putative spermidine/putrescine transport system permease protein